MQSVMEGLAHAYERGEQVEQMRAFDRKAMTRWSDAALATWQTEWPTNSPQWRLGEHEWQRRLLARELLGLWGIAVLAGVFGLAGVALGAFLAARGFFLA